MRDDRLAAFQRYAEARERGTQIRPKDAQRAADHHSRALSCANPLAIPFQTPETFRRFFAPGQVRRTDPSQHDPSRHHPRAVETDGSAVAVLGDAVWRAGHLLPILLALSQGEPWPERPAGRPGHGGVSPGRPRWPTGVGLSRRPHRCPQNRAGRHHAWHGAWLHRVLVRQELRRAAAGLDALCRVLYQPHPAGAWR